MNAWTRFFISALLTWIAGYVDAVGWLTYRHIYTANMSGNSVGIGTSAALAHWPETALRAWPVLLYVAGVLACRIFIEAAARRAIRRIAWLMFGIEIALLAATELRPALYLGI